MTVLRFATYNLRDLSLYRARDRDGAQKRRFEQAAEVIASLDADVVAVQEILAKTPERAGACLGRLADLAGMSAVIRPAWSGEDDAADAEYAIGFGAHRLHVGLMWAPHLRYVPGSYRTWGPGDLWHSLVRVALETSTGQRIEYASYHATPFGRAMRADQAERVVAALTRPTRPLLIGADWNCICADRTGSGVLYEADWYAEQPWRPDFVHQCQWDYQDGRRRHWADRSAGEVLYAGGLYDAAAALSAPWQPSTGHGPDDPFGPRRVDSIRVSELILPALQSIDVARTDLTLTASDHLPVILTHTLTGIITSDLA